MSWNLRVTGLLSLPHSLGSDRSGPERRERGRQGTAVFLKFHVPSIPIATYMERLGKLCN